MVYNLAEGMMPLQKCRVLVKCVRDNTVHLISGKDDHRAAEEYRPEHSRTLSVASYFVHQKRFRS